MNDNFKRSKCWKFFLCFRYFFMGGSQQNHSKKYLAPNSHQKLNKDLYNYFCTKKMKHIFKRISHCFAL